MKIIGIMTGNSLDACDVVLTSFDNGQIVDIASLSNESSDELRQSILALKHKIKTQQITRNDLLNDELFLSTHQSYLKWVAKSVDLLLLNNHISYQEIDAIGFHGQTLDHCPPSISNSQAPYSLQMGSGIELAQLTKIPVIYDFRSDDILNGGEGAPLMPPHNAHLSYQLGLKEALFINAGNTSNIALIKENKALMGFDCGPFNEFPDKLVQRCFNQPYDKEALLGQKGVLNPDLLKQLFCLSAQTQEGKNFFEALPPKSGDPKWYHFDAVITKDLLTQTQIYNTLYTLEYFSAYCVVYALFYAIEQNKLPTDIVLFGGGWHNVIARQTFEDLLDQSKKMFVLEAHRSVFDQIQKAFLKKPNIRYIKQSPYMEARLMADLAYHYLTQKPWTHPDLTGCQSPCILGIKADPEQKTFKEDMISRSYQLK